MQSVPRERPRFRQDLVAEAIEHQGARFIDVMAPEGDDVFRFYESEYSLACGMDGERDVASIVKWAQDELGMTPSHNEVRSVIATLGDLGFIADAEAPELAAGVVAAPPEPLDAAPGLELGAAGTASPRGGGALPPAPDLALGAAGAAGPRIARPTPMPGELALGAAGARAARPTPMPGELSDVSIDLSDHIAVRPDDVKEAVRASRVMSAVEAPPGVLDVITDSPSAAASAFDAPTVMRPPETARLSELTRSPTPEISRPEISRPEISRPEIARPELSPDTIRVGKSPPSRQQPAAVKPPVELPPAPPPPAHIEKTARVSPPAAPRSGTSPVLLVALVLAVLGGGGFLAWRYVIDKPAIDADTSAVPAPLPVKPAPPPPPPPPPPSAKIALETPDPVDVKLTRAGVIETLLADKSVVKEGDVIAKLVGDKPIEAEVAGLLRDQKRLQDLIDAATRRLDTAHAAGNKAAETGAQNEINDRQRSRDTKQNQLAAKTAELDTFLIRAPAAGTFAPAVKLGQKVALTLVIAKVVREPIPVATFKLANTKSFAANAGVEVSTRKGEQRVTCIVSDVQTDSVKVNCPIDPELTEGADVALLAPGATAPSAPEAPPPGPAAPAGAAATAPSEAPAGAPAAGSAAPGPASGSGSAAQ